MSFPSEGKLITYAAINLTLVLQSHWLISSCFVTLQVVQGYSLLRIVAYLALKLPL